MLRKSYLVCDRGGIIKFVSEEKGDDNPLDLEETVGDSLNEPLQNLENAVPNKGNFELKNENGDIKASAGVSSTWGQMSESNPAGKDPECTGYMRLEKENMGMIGVKMDMIKKKTEIEKNFDGLKKMVGE